MHGELEIPLVYRCMHDLTEGKNTKDANTKGAPKKKALRTLTLLVAWKIWNKRNRKTFQQKSY